MQVRIEQVHPLSQMDSLMVGNRDGYKSVGAFVRNWGPHFITALVVPGGFVIVLLLLLRYWNQRRQARILVGRATA